MTRVVALCAVVATLAALASCSDDSDSPGAKAPADTTATEVQQLDVCTLVGRENAAAFLEQVGGDPIDQQQGQATDIAAVCGWFPEPTGEQGAQEVSSMGLIVRVQPQDGEGTDLCAEREGPQVAQLAVPAGDGDAPDEANGWVTEQDGRVETAARHGGWCIYARGPLGATPGGATATEAATSLLSTVMGALPPAA